MRALLALLLLTTPLLGCIGTTDTDEPVTPDSAEGAAMFSDTTVFPGDYDVDGPFSVVLEKGPFDLLPGIVEYLDSPVDGVAIQLAVVRPDVPEGELVPVIVLASPYHPALQAIDLHAYQRRLVENFVPHGFAVAHVAVRGTADSGGCSDLFGPMETADLDAAITWLGEQPWSNGNVGMLGVSYDGSTPWIVAGTGNPYLKTIVPISGLSDVFQLEYRNGTVEERMLGLVSTLYWAYGFGLNNPANGRDAGRTVEGFVCPQVAQGIAASMESGVTGERDAAGFFDARNHRPRVEENYQGSIFLVHGLQDWNVDPHHAYPWVSDLQAKGFVVKHLLGQWGHAWPDSYLRFDETRARGDWAEILLHWFQRELKGMDVDVGAQVQVQDNRLDWRNEAEWPPADATPTPLWLGPQGLVWEEPTDTASHLITPESSLVFGEPVGFGLRSVCDVCYFFGGEPAVEGFRIAGMPRVHLKVTPTAPGGAIAAYLYEQTSKGEVIRIGWTQMDLRFHEGGEQATTVTPGEPIIAKMWLEPLDAVVEKGSKLYLVVGMKQDDRVNMLQGAPFILHTDKDSKLTLDLFQRPADALFEAP